MSRAPFEHMRKTVNPTVPLDNNRLRLSKPKSKAAGIPAVISSAKHSVRKMSLTRTVKSLTMVNQKSGFDCPGCAWPDPEHRTSFEFCENGAKAVACLLYTSPSPRDGLLSRMPSSA